MGRKDTELITAIKNSRRESSYDPVEFSLCSLPGTVIITEDLSSDLLYDMERNQELLEQTSVSFEPNAARLAYEIAKNSASVGRVTRVYVEKIYRDEMTVVGIGFRWAHETRNNFRYRECYVAPDGRLLLENHTDFFSNHEEEGVDPTEFLKYYQQFITDPKYAHNECAGQAGHITSLVED